MLTTGWAAKWGAFALLFFLATMSWATGDKPSKGVDLDAPAAAAVPTLRSEMKRGDDAAFDCRIRSLMDATATSVCVTSVLHSNEQQNRATEPFKFGLYMSSTLSAVFGYQVAVKNGRDGYNEQQRLRRYYDLAKEAADKSGVPLESICEVSSYKKDWCSATIREAPWQSVARQ